MLASLRQFNTIPQFRLNASTASSPEAASSAKTADPFVRFADISPNRGISPCPSDIPPTGAPFPKGALVIGFSDIDWTVYDTRKRTAV